MTSTRINASFVVLLFVVAALMGGTAGHSAPPVESTTSVLVQAADVATASRLVGAVGGTVTHELGIIRAVGARLTAAQRDRLAGMQGVLHLYENGRLLVAAVDDQSLTVLDEFSQSLWNDGFLWNDSLIEPVGVNHWVEQQ